MSKVTIHQAKTNLSELIRRVEAGEEIVIARGDKPVAVLRSYDRDEIVRRRREGMDCLAGKLPPTPDGAFFDPMTDEEFAKAFGGDFLHLHRAREQGAQ